MLQLEELIAIIENSNSPILLVLIIAMIIMAMVIRQLIRHGYIDFRYTTKKNKK